MNIFVKTTYANIYDQPTFSSSMVTQALLWEKLEVLLMKSPTWIKVRQRDGYEGWVYNFYIEFSSYPQKIWEASSKFVVRQPILKLRENASKDSHVVGYATLNSEIPFSDKNNSGLSSVDLPNGQIAWVNVKDDVSKTDFDKTFSSISTSLLGCPYLWGGKTPFGFDCSGLVQTIFKSMDIEISRDTSTQIDDEEFVEVKDNRYEIGDVIFFNIHSDSVDHVGLYYGDNMVIHCSGVVKIESLIESPSVITPGLPLNKVISVRRYKYKDIYKS